MKIEEIEITGQGFSLMLDVDVEYVDIDGRDSGETGSRSTYERILTDVSYPQGLRQFINSNDSYRQQVFAQVNEHLTKYGE